MVLPGTGMTGSKSSLATSPGWETAAWQHSTAHGDHPCHLQGTGQWEGGIILPALFPRMNQAPTVGFEGDVGGRTTHHFMYPESAKNLPANVSFVLVPFKTLDLLWIASALSTGQIRL